MRGDEFAHKRTRGLRAQFAERALLHDAAFVHEDNFVAEKSGFGQIVRDENGRLLQSLKNLLQIFLQCCPNEWIERTERLVEEKKLRREGERAHEADALTLSAGKFGGKPIESLSWEAGQCAQLIERDSFVQLTRHQQNISARSQVREEATVLNDVADAMPKFGDVR